MRHVSILLSSVLVAGALASGCATQRAAISQAPQAAAARPTVAGQLRDGSGGNVAIIPHAFAGTEIGSSIAPNMDAEDLHVAGLALTDARTQQSTRWHNAATGVEYVLVPTATFQGPDGQCRKFTMVA